MTCYRGCDFLLTVISFTLSEVSLADQASSKSGGISARASRKGRALPYAVVRSSRKVAEKSTSNYHLSYSGRASTKYTAIDVQETRRKDSSIQGQGLSIPLSTNVGWIDTRQLLSALVLPNHV